jgi:hypothetical protein
MSEVRRRPCCGAMCDVRAESERLREELVRRARTVSRPGSIGSARVQEDVRERQLQAAQRDLDALGTCIASVAGGW